jgi:thymidylate kinase
MTAGFDRHRSDSKGPSQLAAAARSTLRLIAWLAEEWYRAFVAWVYRRQRYLVVYDRHFFYDYYASDVQPRDDRQLASRIHGFVLSRLYPRPDLVVCLDAPPEVLHARKGEQSLDFLRRRREEYLGLALVEPNFRVVDASRSLDTVVDDVAQLVLAYQR